VRADADLVAFKRFCAEERKGAQRARGRVAQGKTAGRRRAMVSRRGDASPPQDSVHESIPHGAVAPHRGWWAKQAILSRRLTSTR
jgi:hypothetical protein